MMTTVFLFVEHSHVYEKAPIFLEDTKRVSISLLLFKNIVQRCWSFVQAGEESRNDDIAV
jgi:hypothetical protein